MLARALQGEGALVLDAEQAEEQAEDLVSEEVLPVPTVLQSRCPKKTNENFSNRKRKR